MLKIMKASAGSGKTYNLARTYISLLLRDSDRFAYRHILAVTFTNKATDEMKNRILKELHVLATDPFRSAYRKDFVPSVFASEEDMQRKAQAVLRDILHDYSAFAVSTIDRFFQQTLKAFSREIGQFASYQVELDRNSIVAESVDRILDSLTDDDDSLLPWFTDNVLEQIEQGGRYSMDANLLDMALRMKSSQRQEAIEKAAVDEDKAYSKDRLLEIRKACRDIKTSFREKVERCAGTAVAALEASGVDAAESNRGFLKHLYDYVGLGQADAIVIPKDTFLAKAADTQQWFAKSKASRLLPVVCPGLEAPLNEFCALWGKEYAVYNTACILDGQIYGLGVAGELRKTFNDIMKEKNVLCIEDSNTILRDIIDGSDAPFVYEKLGVRFEHFLLDEFQDTSAVQWNNFSPLLHNSDAQGGENLIVGDVKQSIYRWRGSDWKLLDADIPQEFPEHEEQVLDTNYRSLPAVVEFNNAFFEDTAVLLDALSGHEDGGPMSRIYADVKQKVARTGGMQGAVSLAFCPKENELDEVLSMVQRLRSDGALYSDIAVLVRSNAYGEQVAGHLVQNGVPVITDDSLKVKSSLTVRRLVSLMSYAENASDTVGGFLAESLEVDMPEDYVSLEDMAESLVRSIKKSDIQELWKGEVLHIRSFMDALHDYVSSNGNCLRGFLKYWEEKDPSIASESSGDSVRIMTIHKSKGLDFPFVILPFAENISLFTPDSHWCAPDLDGTDLEGVAEGVYDVNLSGSSAHSLFRDHYIQENFLQQVDNMNVIYVALTRAALGMHIISKIPSTKFLNALETGSTPEISDFSQILYRFADRSDMDREQDDITERFSAGESIDFCGCHRDEKFGVSVFELSDEYPSYPLNPEKGDALEDVRERGRMKYTADSIDFFSTDGDAGIEASNRIRGVVLHDILSRVIIPSDLESAVAAMVGCGDLEPGQVSQVTQMLKAALKQGCGMGWFPEDRDRVMTEVSVMDTGGLVLRPDRVVKDGKKIMIVDYKFGEHRRGYERQMERYADVFRRMGYEDVEAYLWYVQTGEIKSVV